MKDVRSHGTGPVCALAILRNASCPLDQFTSARFNRRSANMTNREPIQRERTCLPALSPLGPHLRGHNEEASTETRSYERIRDDASPGKGLRPPVPACYNSAPMVQHPPWSGMVPASVFNPSLLAACGLRGATSWHYRH